MTLSNRSGPHFCSKAGHSPGSILNAFLFLGDKDQCKGVKVDQLHPLYSRSSHRVLDRGRATPIRSTKENSPAPVHKAHTNL